MGTAVRPLLTAAKDGNRLPGNRLEYEQLETVEEEEVAASAELADDWPIEPEDGYARLEPPTNDTIKHISIKLTGDTICCFNEIFINTKMYSYRTSRKELPFHLNTYRIRGNEKKVRCLLKTCSKKSSVSKQSRNLELTRQSHLGRRFLWVKQQGGNWPLARSESKTFCGHNCFRGPLFDGAVRLAL